MRLLLIVVVCVLVAALLTSCATGGGGGKKPFIPHPDWDRAHPLLRPGTFDRNVGVQLHVHEITERDFQLLRQLEPGVIRCDFPPDVFSTELGAPDLSIPIQILQFAETIHARVIFTWGYSTRQSGPFHSSDRAWLDYLDYVKRVIGHFHFLGYPVIWEFWNEPNHEAFWGADPNTYMQYAIGLMKVIRSEAAESCIVGPAAAGMDWKWTQKLFDLGFLKLVDGVSVHPYRSDPPETLAADYNRLQKMIYDATGGNWKPIVCGELGWGAVKDESERAEWMKRTFLVNEEAGVPLTVYYQWRNGETAILDGMMEPGDLFYGFEALSNALKGFRWETGWSFDTGLHAQQYENDSGELRIVTWKPKGKVATFLMLSGVGFLATDRVQVYDDKGNRID